MIFNSNNEFKKDILLRISNYLREHIDNIDIIYLTSLLSSYLFELKIRKEITDYDISDDKTQIINIYFKKNNEEDELIIDIHSELRRIKINKIQQKKNK